MPRILNLPVALKKFGCDKYGPIEVVPGWQTRGDSIFNPRVSIGHHTAGPKSGDRPSLRVVLEGRPGLPGPLAQDFLTRSGIVVVVASGRANHAGVGSYRGFRGNSAAIGNEAEDDGDGNWTEEQMDILPRLHAAHLWLMNQGPENYCSHRTWAEPPGRKIDPTGIADGWMRSRIMTVTREVLHAIPEAPVSIKEDDMKLVVAQTKDDNEQWLITGSHKIHIRERGVFEWLLAQSKSKDSFVENWGEVPASVLNHFPTRLWSAAGFPVDWGYEAHQAVLRVAEQLQSLAGSTADDATAANIKSAVDEIKSAIAGTTIVP